MKIFLVVTEQDGVLTRELGKATREIKRIERRFAGETIYDVWDEVQMLPLTEYDESLIGIWEEHPSIVVLGKK